MRTRLEEAQVTGARTRLNAEGEEIEEFAKHEDAPVGEGPPVEDEAIVDDLEACNNGSFGAPDGLSG